MPRLFIVFAILFAIFQLLAAKDAPALPDLNQINAIANDVAKLLFKRDEAV